MIADHPLFGCGPGNFQNAYTHYKLPEASEEVADPHNFLLEIWATAGTPAMLAFLAVLACFLAEGGRRRAEGGRESGQRAVDSDQCGPEPPIPNPQSLIPTCPDAWIHVLAGGALGFLLSVPVGMLSAAPPGTGRGAASDCRWRPSPSDCSGAGFEKADGCRCFRRSGLWSLLVDLLATGGIGLPSVAGTLWLLLALGLQGERPHELRLRNAWAALAVAVGLAVACYCTAYNPVLACQAQLRMAEREPLRAVEHLEAAAAADPLSAEPWRQLAAIHFQTWWQSPDEDTFRRFEQANAQALSRAPNSSVAWLAVGRLVLPGGLQNGSTGG